MTESLHPPPTPAGRLAGVQPCCRREPNGWTEREFGQTVRCAAMVAESSSAGGVTFMLAACCAGIPSAQGSMPPQVRSKLLDPPGGKSTRCEGGYEPKKESVLRVASWRC